MKVYSLLLIRQFRLMLQTQDLLCLDRHLEDASGPARKALNELLNHSSMAMNGNKRQQVSFSTNVASVANAEPPPSTRSGDLKDSLAGFLQVISKSSRGHQDIEDILTQAQNSFQRAEQEAEKNVVPGNDSSVGVSSSTNVATGETEEESDVDPDTVDIGVQESLEGISRRIVEDGKTDRNIRARRRAAQAEGHSIPADIMTDRKHITEEQKEEVTLKVRSGRVLYTFVRSRKENLRGLRKELELLAELPRHLKFELQYQSKAIQDIDTPACLGIHGRGRLRVKRKEITAGDSSDDVIEVDRKKHRSNLIKVTIQDEKGKKHDFQHDRDTKLGSMFRAFARLCQNDVFSYRFFLDGVRLTNDDKPTDYEEFEEGALIDAFFEAQGGRRHIFVFHPIA